MPGFKDMKLRAASANNASPPQALTTLSHTIIVKNISMLVITGNL